MAGGADKEETAETLEKRNHSRVPSFLGFSGHFSCIGSANFFFGPRFLFLFLF
jgi:hypothetical protein